MGLAGPLLVLLFSLLLLAVILAPLVDKVLTHFSDSSSSAANVPRVKEIARAGRALTRPNRDPDKYRDTQIDELIQERRLEEAAILAAERLRLAHEHALDDRVAFYREYERLIADLQQRT